MDRNLPNYLDDFFSGYLKNYTEEPARNAWFEINERLSKKRNKRRSKPVMVGLAVIIITLLLAPVFITNPFSYQLKLTGKNAGYKRRDVYHYKNNYITTAVSTEKNINVNNTGYVLSDTNKAAINNITKNDLHIAEILSPHNRFELNTEKILQQMNVTSSLKFEYHALPAQNKIISKASTTIKLSGKHTFNISPFFSFDHISGRFIEKYEFDNESKDDYEQREKPDMSFTTGLLTEHTIKKNLSVLTGLSFSSSNLSISTTAVNALKDEDGIYKFKLATSYGLAEISESGITPQAGDSLVVSNGSLKLNYISLPVMLNYNFKKRKIDVSVHGGIAANKILSDKVEAEYNIQNNNELETVNKIEGIKKLFFTMNAGIEVSYPVSRKLNISVSPELRYGINSINKQTPIKTYPINYGVALHANIIL